MICPFKLPEGVAWACEPILDDTGLFPDERGQIAGAVDKRRAEFAAGRRAARHALDQIGFEETAIMSSPDRAPIWPDGVVGSIGHDQGIAVSLVASAQHVRAIGVDVTEAAPLPHGVPHVVLHGEAEQELDAIDARAVFAAKETLFKALFPEVQNFFGFDAAEIRPDLKNERFEARLTRALGPFQESQVFEGHLAIADKRLLAALILER